MTAYYNEIDPFAAAWLRELIAAGYIAPGDVDTRSIADVRPDDLTGYTQCHFFAGIGVWSYALRRAGWADTRPVWTGSCPCQPFSAAGKGGGFDDERHLWPHFHWLISQCRPGVVLGEQVASKDGLAWLDLVSADLEGTGYACGAVDLCAAGVGAPHIRQRLWWAAERLADAHNERHAGIDALLREEAAGRFARHLPEAAGRGAAGGLDDHDDARLEGQRGRHRAALGHGQGSVRPTSEAGQSGGLGHPERLGAGRDAGAGAGAQGGPVLRPIGDGAGSPGPVRGVDDAAGARHVGSIERSEGNSRDEARLRLPGSGRGVGGMADADSRQRNGVSELRRVERHGADAGRPQGGGEPGACGDDDRPGPTNGLWRDADWLFCRDGKWRPVEPGTFPLAHGSPARVGRLRGYGNAIVAEAAVEFIEAVDEALQNHKHLRLMSDLTTYNEGIFA